MALVTCSDCFSQISDATTICPHCARPRHVSSPTLQASGYDRLMTKLEVYIGPNWHSHYRQAFARLLHEQSTGQSAGWTWNWAAALVPFWFLHRGLVKEWFALLIASMVLVPLGLSPLLLIARGYLGDRLLLKQALAGVGSHGLAADPTRITHGIEPLPWYFWAAVVLGGLWTLFLVRMLAG